MNRRKFSIALGSVIAGMTAGTLLMANDDQKTEKEKDKKGKNAKKDKSSCGGKGGCGQPTKQPAKPDPAKK